MPELNEPENPEVIGTADFDLDEEGRVVIPPPYHQEVSEVDEENEEDEGRVDQVRKWRQRGGELRKYSQYASREGRGTALRSTLRGRAPGLVRGAASQAARAGAVEAGEAAATAAVGGGGLLAGAGAVLLVVLGIGVIIAFLYCVYVGFFQQRTSEVTEFVPGGETGMHYKNIRKEGTLSVAKEVKVDNKATPTLLTYTIAVFNDTEFDLSALTLSDPLMPQGVCEKIIGQNMLKGTEAMCTYTVPVTKTDQTLVNTVTVSGLGSDGIKYENADSAAITLGTPSVSGDVPCIRPVAGGYFTNGCWAGHLIKGPANGNAVDIGGVTNSPVYATMSGIAQHCYNAKVYGEHVIITSGSYMTIYGHLVKDSVPLKFGSTGRTGFTSSCGAGAEVKAGEIIGNVDNTGISTGPHLHYEVRINGEAVCPHSYILIPDKSRYKDSRHDFELGKSFLDGTVSVCTTPAKP